MGSVPLLEFAVRYAFFFIVLGLVCSIVNEAIVGVINSRGKTLEKGILYFLLHDPALKAKLYAHPLILGTDGTDLRLPAYIPSNMFALALMDILTGSAATDDPEALREGVKSLEHPAAKTVLSAVLRNPQFTTDQERITAWFDQSMESVSATYTRTTQIRILVLATLVTVLMNLDSIKFVRNYQIGSAMTAILVERAKQCPLDLIASKSTAVSEQDLLKKVEKYAGMTSWSGWRGDWITDWPNHGYGYFWLWIAYLLRDRFGGWLITILILSLAAPYCFDRLRLLNVRSSEKPLEKNN